ncbi:GNAT family N-acetyltransferase [Salinarimonas soli]|uniref:GNAT family N-acetyltransferase n=1 Tax=Salinarimonas soli TaxID=1638099 RepID=A0A5B2VA72_9HYPH|nr:GNAT family N-acetyltransferase [Salinarimonas soli]KAA2235911.1 GNAT family N-acetyltransferase [Salinarimonas soli]
MGLRIAAFAPQHEANVLALSMRSWAPVFEKLRPVVQPCVYETFYPDGWQVRQAADIRQFLAIARQNTWLAVDGDAVLGRVGIRLHPADRMGEIHIIAVDLAHQRRGIASALMNHAMMQMRGTGMRIVMVETGDDPGHAGSRATYERAGFQRWPVACYFLEL